MQKSALVTVLSLVLLGLIAAPARADYLYDRSGTLVVIDGSVLGKDDDSQAENEVEDEVENESEDQAGSVPASSPSSTPNPTEVEKRRVEQKNEQAQKTLEKQIEARKKLNEKKELKSQLEIRSEDGKFKLKQEIRDQSGRVTKKEVELKPGESLHVEDSRGERTEIRPAVMELKDELKDEIKEQRAENREERKQNREQQLELVKDKMKAHTDFSLTVNEENELIVTKPDGSSRVVTVLPDEAVAKLEEKGILVAGVTPELTENTAGEAVYRVTQEAERRILGLALKFKRHTEVSAETGDVVTTSAETNPVKRLLERFLF